MDDHLELAKALADRAATVGHPPSADRKARLAQAHALIAIAEELRRVNGRALAEVERQELLEAIEERLSF